MSDAFDAFKLITCGGMLEVKVKSICRQVGLKLPFKGKVVLFICKTLINSTYSAFCLFVFYLIYFRPYAVRPSVSAAVSAFNLAPARTGNNTLQQLQYDLALNVTFWNDHRIWAIHFKHFSARLYFDGSNISPPDDTFPMFKARTRRHRTVNLLLRGRATNAITAAMMDEFSREREQGWFAMEIRLKSTLNYVVWPTRYKYYYEYDCWLHFPSNATLPVDIGPVKCSKGKRFGLS